MIKATHCSPELKFWKTVCPPPLPIALTATAWSGVIDKLHGVPLMNVLAIKLKHPMGEQGYSVDNTATITL